MTSTTEFHHRDRCAISGIGQTDFSRDSGRSVLTLATQASLAAIADAGLTPQDIDGIVRCDMDLVRSNDLVDALGMTRLDYYGDAGPGGVAPAAQVAQAMAAVISGLATNVLVYRSLNGRSGRRFGLSSVTSSRVGGNGTYDEFFLPYGLLTPGQIFGLIAQRHMLEYGTNDKDLGAIAIACRNRANQNPRAQMRERTLSMDDYLGARMISRPLRLFDFCLETDGAAALIVTSAERARDAPNPPALIRAAAAGSLVNPQPGIQFPVVLREDITTLPSKPTADTLYRRAGLGPSDIDVAQLYDCFTITVLLQLEDFGFCAKGEGGAFVSSGAIELGGSLPINTGGGHLSEGYIHGMNHVVEGVRQVRGTSTSQVPDAEVCLVANNPLPPGSALILRRDS
jgi:acetyl-CoA acetyltransferase